jgi:hypothetical protein
MAGGYHIDPAALRQYVQVVDQQAQKLDQIHQTLAGVQVDVDSFGMLPASSDLRREYTSHARAEVDNSGEAVQLMQETGDGLVQTVDNYERTERSVAEMHHAIRRAL